MQVIINDEALKDIEQIKLYIANDNEVAALKMTNAIFDCIEDLPTLPESGEKLENHTRRRNKYRFKIVEPYLIFYIAQKDTIRVYRVLHVNMQYAKLLEFLT